MSSPDHEPANALTWLHALRRSHDRLAALLADLTEAEVSRPSYAREWTVAQVASHLGSQAQIFDLFLAAGLCDDPAPGGEVFGPIWDHWDALPARQQVRDSIASNESFVSHVEAMTEDAVRRFGLSMFGTDLDLRALLALRLAEHAVHTWDVAVALDPTAAVAPDAVDLLVDSLPERVERAGTPRGDVGPLVVETTQPDHRWRLVAHPAVGLAPLDGEEDAGDDPVRFTGEAFLLLVSGRLDAARAPSDVVGPRLESLQTVFQGF